LQINFRLCIKKKKKKSKKKRKEKEKTKTQNTEKSNVQPEHEQPESV
jgi:hypothetical protein